MDQPTYMTMRQIIGGLYNSFHQGNEDIDVRLATFERYLDGISPQAMQMAADRYCQGDVEPRDKRHGPTVPEFVQEARKQQEIVDLRNRPRVNGPATRPDYGGLAPFQLRQQKARAENAHLPIIAENVSYDQFKLMSRNGEIPVGGKWVAADATVYGPPPAQKQAAE